MRAPIANVVMACVIGGLVAPAGADDRSRPLAVAALAICQHVDVIPQEVRASGMAQLDEGVVMSETAVAADERDARAHLALFCNLGKQIELSGLSWRVFARVRRARAEIDRAQELAPTDPDVLAAKGELLRRL